MIAYKCTRADGTDFRTGTVRYAFGARIEITSDFEGACECNPRHLGPCPVSVGSCGVGLHVSPTPRLTCQFGDRNHRPWRWWKVEIADENVIASDNKKHRVRAVTVLREVMFSEIFGEDFSVRIGKVCEEIATWKSIPWCKPDHRITEAEIAPILGRWHDAISPWLRPGVVLPRRALIVREQRDAADDAVAAADAAADAADAVDDAVAAADVDADAADAVAAAAVADAAAAVADAAAEFYRLWPNWARWYVRPRYALWKAARWRIAAMSGPSPWDPIVELYRMGCAPIGYAWVDGEVVFVVYAPSAKESK